MSDVKKLEERLNNLEAKIKATFAEVEKRLNELSAPRPNDLEERFQELEDLLLLLQVDQMKVKEKLYSSTDILSGDHTIRDAKIAELERIISGMSERIGILENKSKAEPKKEVPGTGTLSQISKILAD